MKIQFIMPCEENQTSNAMNRKSNDVCHEKKHLIYFVN
jgi:hypothetical protein